MKCLLRLLVVAALVLALLGGAFLVLVDKVVQTAVTEGVGYTTQQETHLASADLGLFSGALTLEGLEIENPPGFQQTPLLRVGRFQTVLDYERSSAERIEVDLVELKDLELALELKGSESNVTALLERLGKLRGQPSGSGSEPEDDPEPSAPPEAGPSVGIGSIAISGVRASLRVTAHPTIDGVYELEMPDVVLKDFDSSMDRASMIEWTAYVLEELLTSALSSGQGQFPPEWQGLLAEGLQNEEIMSGDLEGLGKDLEDQVKREIDQALEGLKKDPAAEIQKGLDKLEEHKGALDGLFGGGKDR